MVQISSYQESITFIIIPLLKLISHFKCITCPLILLNTSLTIVIFIFFNGIQILPIIASIRIGAAAYCIMTDRRGQLQNMIPLAEMNSQGPNVQRSKMGSNNQTE